jgi:hypothetical protein
MAVPVELVAHQVRAAAVAARWLSLQLRLLAELAHLQISQVVLLPTEPVAPVVHRRHSVQTSQALQQVQTPVMVAAAHPQRALVVTSMAALVDLV